MKSRSAGASRGGRSRGKTRSSAREGGTGAPGKPAARPRRTTEKPGSDEPPVGEAASDPAEVLIPEIAGPFDEPELDAAALDFAGAEEDAAESPDETSEPETAEPGARQSGKKARARSGARDAAGAVARFDPLGSYIRQVRGIPALTREEEQALARRYRDEKDQDAARRLVVANLSLVVKIALMFRRAIANALDLIQEGNLGLLQAVEKFDPDMGVRFTTYAAWWVKAYILKYLLDNARLVRVGTTNARRKLIYNLQREKARLDALGIAAGPKLLAERFGVSEEDVRDVQATLEAPEIALDAPIGDAEDGKSRMTLLADPGESVEEVVARRELQQTLEEKIRAFASTLSERDRYILENRLLSEDPLTLQAIGEKFSVTREAVRLSEERVIRQLKDYLRTELGEDVLLQVRR